MPKPAPYGTWRSPITPALICAQGVRLGEPRIAGDALYWIESRPAENGRSVLVRRDADGHTADVTPAPYSVRSHVHEYGGGAAVVAGEEIYFVNDADQRIYRQAPGAAPAPLTPANACRYADMECDSARRRLIVVAEDHGDASRQPDNRLVSVGLAGGAITLAAGADFYSSPRLSRDGRRLAWLQWNQPDMPWDAAELWLAELGPDGGVRASRRIAGGGESVFQPEFSPRGVLHFISDRDGWWNLYRYGGGVTRQLTRERAEFGRPQWQFNMRTYGFIDADTVAACYTQDGIWHLAEIDVAGRLRVLKLPYTLIEHLHAANGRIVLLAASPHASAAVVAVDPVTDSAVPVHSVAATTLSADDLSVARPLSYATRDGETAHALYYPPRNPKYSGPRGERPPLLVKCHGGPTAATDASLDLSLQYWTSRGFAVLDVNYRGSTGYGREYRRRLYGEWGILDVADCLDGARHLVRGKRVDPARLAIRGSSAGGYTALAALAYHRLFKAGASYYGIGDLETAMTDTHKFESRYGESLIGPYPAARDVYRERSPLNAAGRLNCPVIFFQGLKDRVVPPDQAERMAAALTAKGVPVAYLTFANEAHGFRAAATIRATLEAELYFYGRVFGFAPADALPGVIIRNSDAL